MYAIRKLSITIITIFKKALHFSSTKSGTKATRFMLVVKLTNVKSDTQQTHGINIRGVLDSNDGYCMDVSD